MKYPHSVMGSFYFTFARYFGGFFFGTRNQEMMAVRT